MSALYVGIIALSAVGLYYSARLEGYCAGLRYQEEQRRQAVDAHRDWLFDHLPQEPGIGSGQRDSL